MTTESSSSSHADKSPRKVVRMGHYKIYKHIATGGMGAVYRRTTRSRSARWP